MNDKHILIIGHPRGGTSLLFNMMCAAYPRMQHADDEVRATDELDLRGDRISKAPIDSVHHTEIVSIARALGKDLFVISITRDPRDVIVAQHVGGGYACWPDAYRVKDGRALKHLGYLELYNGQGDWARWSRETAHRTLTYERYEDLVQYTVLVQTRISAFLNKSVEGFPFDRFYECKDLPMKAGQRNQPVHTNEVGRWKKPKHRDHLVKCFESDEMRQTVIELGYENNDWWYNKL